MNSFHIRTLDITALLVFGTLVEEGSVVRTAERLGMTQSAVSHALKRLRTVWDDPLFVRKDGRMILTSKASGLAAGVANTLRELNGLVDTRSDFDPGSDRRRFVLGMSDYAASIYLPVLTRHCEGSANRLTLLIRHTSRAIGFDMLRRGEVEAVIGSFPEAPPDLRRQALSDEDFVCAARAGHPAFAGGSIELDAYLQAQHLHVSLAGEASGMIDTALAKIGRKRRVTVTAPHFLVVGRVLSGSDLIATEPRAVLAPLAKLHGLEVRELPFAADGFDFSILWHRRSDPDPALAWLRRVVAERDDRAAALRPSAVKPGGSSGHGPRGELSAC